MGNEPRNHTVDKPFKCPNCGELMVFAGETKIDIATYDAWHCDDCSHIIVLDWRR